jgi:outer membrane protein OmpA-like peptidoglycan-associated protein
MRLWGLKRRVLFLLCVVSVLLAGCVSKGKYTDLESKYTELQDAIKYTVNSDLLFRSGSSEMSKEGQEVIAKLAPRLAPFQQSKIVVNGYTDNAPVGRALQRQGIPSNEVLSQKRAEAVRQYLIAQGVKPDMIAARGLGEAEPIASNATAEGRAQNRRVELTLTGQTAP